VKQNSDRKMGRQNLCIVFIHRASGGWQFKRGLTKIAIFFGGFQEIKLNSSLYYSTLDDIPTQRPLRLSDHPTNFLRKTPTMDKSTHNTQIELDSGLD
jgi:hypothetical protein